MSNLVHFPPKGQQQQDYKPTWMEWANWYLFEKPGFATIWDRIIRKKSFCVEYDEVMASHQVRMIGVPGRLTYENHQLFVDGVLFLAGRDYEIHKASGFLDQFVSGYIEFEEDIVLEGDMIQFFWV